nr:Uncharacterised protein [Klebsiella pneumoniae]
MICHHIAHGAFGIGEVALALAGGQQFLQFCWLCVWLKVGTKARIMALIYSSALVLAAFCSGPWIGSR